MKNYKITINGNTYDVGVEELNGNTEIKTVKTESMAPKAVAAPKAAPVAAPATVKPSAPPVKAGSGDVTAPLAGTILSVSVTEGQKVKAGQVLVVFEAMKMENEIVAPIEGTVKKLNVSKGTVMETGMIIATIA